MARNPVHLILECRMAKLNPFDLYDIESLLSEDERMVRDSVARFVDERAMPLIARHFDEARFPTELVPEIAGLGLLGSSLEGYGTSWDTRERPLPEP